MLPEFRLHPQQAVHLREQVVHFERLFDEDVRPAFEGLHLAGGVTRQDDDRDMAGLETAPQRTAHLEAVGFGHHQVGDDHLRTDPLHGFQAFRAT